jgi:hypothetical protein
MTYYDKLKDPRWQKLRLQVFERDKWTCRDCGATDRPLHAHHAFYEKGVEPWDYLPHTIMCVCDNCHEKRHRLIDTITSFSGLLSIDLMENVSRLIRLVRLINAMKHKELANNVIIKTISLLKKKSKSKVDKDKNPSLMETIDEL